MSGARPRAERLLSELVGVGLSETDAHRAAFVALALSRGWTKARVARYLGLTRQRVGQKADKLHDYAAEHEGMETLRRVMAVAATAEPERRDTDDLIRYDQDDWEDPRFARGLVDMVAAPDDSGR